MKIKHKPYIFLTFLTLIAVWFFVCRFAPFASNSDWSSQHSVIPEQFRQQFYATGKLLCEFVPGLGGGQNVYYFSYYGLYNPVILPSYLLPFVKMGDYLMAASVLCLIASVLLMYYWLGTHGFSTQVRLSAAVLFLLAAPMIYHSHRHIMFVDYMPFLCMALVGVDRYWKKGKPGLYIAGVFLMIMTSFYFSIAGLLALCLYGVSRCEKEAAKKKVFGLVLPTAAAVCLAGFLLIPTAYTLFERSGCSRKMSLTALFFPDISTERFLYRGYSIGLTAVVVAVLFLGIACKHLKERFLSAGCLIVIVVPFFSWILNGGLYARGKSLIPFLPVLCYLTAVCLEKIRTREISIRMCLAGYLAAAIYSISAFLFCQHGALSEQYMLIFMELLLLPISFALCRRTKLFCILLAPSFFCLLLSDLFLNQEKPLDAAFYQDVTDPAWGQVISDTLQKEPGLYRLEQAGTHEEKKANINRTWDARQWSVSSYSSAYQKNYQDFQKTVFQTEQPFRNCMMQPFSENPLFQRFMGIKYLVQKSSGDLPQVLIQEHAAPLIYATDQIIAEDSYRKLSFPYNQTALMQYAVAKDGRKKDAAQIASSMPEIEETEILISESDSVHKTDNGYSINIKDEIKTTLLIGDHTVDTDEEQLFFLQFDVENNRNNRDVIIELAGVRNNLSAKNHLYYNGNTTFTYVMKQSKQQKSIELLLKAGKYDISNIRGFLGDASVLAEDSLYQSEFVPDWNSTRGNRICGKLDVKRDGYLITSIPFDRGFEIWIDGKETEPETVNTSFLGAKIAHGEHEITIVYHAPGAFLGKIFSVMGVLLLGVMKAFGERDFQWERRG